jgi:pilus assembly protein CpaE
VIGLLKATFSHVILDLSKSYNALDMVALEQANHILLITQLDLPCLRNVVRLMMSLSEMETIKDKIKIMVNRVGLDNQISLKKAKDTMGREVFWQLPNDYRTMVEVRNNGVPLIEQAPKAAITQSIVALAHALGGDPRAETVSDAGKSTIGKWLNLWPGKQNASAKAAAAPAK